MITRITKTDMAAEQYEKGNVLGALQIAKDFKLGITKEERDQIIRAYECWVHPGFYKQIGKDPETEIAKGVTVFSKKIFHPYQERKAGVSNV